MSSISEVLKRLYAGVEFSEPVKDSKYCGVNLSWFDFSGKFVADFTGASEELTRDLKTRGANRVVLCTRGKFEVENSDVEFWAGDIFDFPETGVDYAFFDPRELDSFDDVEDVFRILERLSSILSPTGSCFIVLRTGAVHADWDVYNSIVLTPYGPLPSSPYLYNSMLADFAVRPLIRIHEESDTHRVTRVFRLAPKKNTLLLVVGHSQAGKTTLARSFLKDRPGTHLSSDYVYFNLFQNRDRLDQYQTLARILGNATAEDTGNFFRSLEQETGAMEEYVSLVSTLLPSAGTVSMDIDLRLPESVEFVKQKLDALGYSVWVVSR